MSAADSSTDSVKSSELPHRRLVVAFLRGAMADLSKAHGAATEREGTDMGLTGSVRDAIFGLNTAVEALVQMIEDDRFGPDDGLHTWENFIQAGKEHGRWQCKVCGRTAYTREPPTDYPPCSRWVSDGDTD